MVHFKCNYLHIKTSDQLLKKEEDAIPHLSVCLEAFSYVEIENLIVSRNPFGESAGERALNIVMVIPR